MIATDGISDEHKATEKFLSAYAEMTRNLAKPNFIAALCAHEAAHLVYYEMMGHQTQVELLPPRLEYSAEKQAFTGHYAAIKLAEEPLCEPDKWREYVTAMAYVNVAGGVVGRKLFPSSSGGDEGDKEKFRKLCVELTDHLGGISMDVEMCWKSAQHTVERQLEDNPQIMERIQQRAVELRPLFGL